MNARQRRRLRAPLLTATCGLGLSVAVALAARWTAALPVAAITVVAAATYYWLGGTDTDVGALIGSRPDERQEAVRLWVRAFAAVALLLLATIGAVVSASLHRVAWPYAAIVGLGSICFLAGLGWYRRGSRVSGHALRRDRRSPLDERQAAVVLHALQLAGIVMFLAAIAGGLGLSRSPDDADPLRILASLFAAALGLGFLLFWPRNRNWNG